MSGNTTANGISNPFGSTGFNGGDGGGICNSNMLTLENCTVAGNRTGNGGTDTINGNAGRGGGIFNAGVLVLKNSTVSTNVTGTGPVSRGGGIFNSGTLLLTNTIVAANAAPTNPNLDGSFTGAGNLTSGDPMLSVLGNYGGPTQTMPPLPGSPAIDAGNDAAAIAFAYDQRGVGYPRLVGTHVDIGAVEVQLVTSPIPAGLAGVTRLGNGSIQFSFTNLTGASFTVFGSTNVALPFAQWSNLGSPVESPAGTFTFTDPQATNHMHRFYRVTSP